MDYRTSGREGVRRRACGCGDDYTIRLCTPIIPAPRYRIARDSPPLPSGVGHRRIYRSCSDADSSRGAEQPHSSPAMPLIAHLASKYIQIEGRNILVSPPGVMLRSWSWNEHDKRMRFRIVALPSKTLFNALAKSSISGQDDQNFLDVREH